MQKLLILGAVFIAFAWATSRWRKATQAVMVLLIFEGALRKWVFPGAEQLLYFAKDILLLGCYVGYFRSQAARRYRLPVSPALLVLLSLGAAWGAFEIFNPNLPNMLVGIAGFKAYFLYVPMMFLLPACFDSDEQVVAFLRRYVLLGIPVGVLALLQFASPASSGLNAYARSSEEGYVATFGSSEHVRVTATFPFITGYTSYLLASAILLLALLGASRWRYQPNRKLYLCLGFTVLGMLMSGSRGPVFMLALLFPFYWYLAVMRERDAGLTVSRAVLAASFLAVLMAALAGNAVTAFIGRAAASSDTSSRLTSPLMSPYLLLPEAGVFGFGIGSTHQTAAALAPSIIPYSWLHGLLVEVEPGKVMLELGAVGFVLIYLARLSLVILAFGYAKRLHTRFHRALAIGSFLFFTAQVLGTPVFDVTCGVYFWFFAGLMMLAVRLDREAVRAAARQPRAEGLPRHQPPQLQPVHAHWQSRRALRGS
ncbi:MAG TPA: hypothetical protein VGV61_07300 [Thermoanaerobaculia bacterium]|jgi:hypothetical protein|nr:hypothetical protein [Thermoanaerobaculia bacterium]